MGDLTQRRPAETGQAGATAAVNAVFLILTGFGVHVAPAVIAGVNVLVGLVAALITRVVSQSRAA